MYMKSADHEDSRTIKIGGILFLYNDPRTESSPLEVVRDSNTVANIPITGPDLIFLFKSIAPLLNVCVYKT